MLSAPMPAISDPEGEKVPESLPFIVDAHVHVFPDSIFPSIWQWFEQFGWPIRYRLKTQEVVDFLLTRGIGHVVALHYAHKPGIARNLNAYMAELCLHNRAVTGFATVFPGEEDAAEILRDAFALGLKGVKLHMHVQCFEMESEDMRVVYDACTDYEKPLVMHAGREPKSPAYPCDPHELCSADRLERVIRAYPKLKICVPHLGSDEYGAYQRMLEKYDNLWLDTTMMLADYFPNTQAPPLTVFRSDRIMYGTDFPNLPYAWDRELNRLVSLDLHDDLVEKVLGGNASVFFKLDKGSA